MPQLRLATSRDQHAVLTFLEQHPGTTMFLRSNILRAGIDDRGRRYQGKYVIAEEGKAIVGVAAHFWNGMLVLEAPRELESLTLLAVRESGLGIKGILGRCRQVEAARRIMGLMQQPASLESQEDLFLLELNALQVPEALASGAVQCRSPKTSELDLITEWRALYAVEALAEEDNEALRESAAASVKQHQQEGNHWVLVRGGSIVSYTAFNARVPGCVQVGGVFTPIEHRSKGFARSAVAGSLLQSRNEGTKQAILFTNVGNTPAKKAYQALGFQRIGDYGIVLFRDEQNQKG